MSEEQRSKICPFCEGRIPIQSMNCNYCGSGLDNIVHLHRDQNDLFSEDGFDSVLTPPYLDENTNDEQQEQLPSDGVVKKQSESKGLVSLFLLCFSVQLTVIALMLLFFSEDGALVFEFNAAYWPVYLFISLPLLYWGVQSFDAFDKDFTSES